MKKLCFCISLTAVFALFGSRSWAAPVPDGDGPRYVILDDGDIEEADFAVKAYPSPFINELNLENRGSDEVTVRVLDVLGKVVATMSLETGQKVTLNTIDLPKGMFFVQTVVDQRQHTMKLFKINE